VLLSEVSEEIPSHLRCIILQSAGVAGAQVGHFERKLYLEDGRHLPTAVGVRKLE